MFASGCEKIYRQSAWFRYFQDNTAHAEWMTAGATKHSTRTTFRSIMWDSTMYIVRQYEYCMLYSMQIKFGSKKKAKTKIRAKAQDTAASPFLPLEELCLNPTILSIVCFAVELSSYHWQLAFLPSDAHDAQNRHDLSHVLTALSRLPQPCLNGQAYFDMCFPESFIAQELAWTLHLYPSLDMVLPRDPRSVSSTESMSTRLDTVGAYSTPPVHNVHFSTCR